MYRQDDPEINIDEIAKKIKSIFGRFGGGSVGPTFFFIVIIVIVLGWLGTGLFTVQPGEQAALKMFGKYSETKDPGLSWWWPTPIGGRDVVKVDEV